MAHAVNLACHVLVTTSATIKMHPTGEQMIELLVLRFKELKGRAYAVETRDAITQVVDFEVRQARERKEAKSEFKWGRRGSKKGGRRTHA